MTISTAASHVPVVAFTASIDNEVVSVLAANDFGALRLRDTTGSVDLLPLQNLLILGAQLDLFVQLTGFSSNTVSTLTVGMGTATAALGSVVTLTPAGQNIVTQFAATGGSASGAITRNTFAQVSPISIMNSTTSNPLFLNFLGACTADATITVTGTVTVFALPLGSL